MHELRLMTVNMEDEMLQGFFVKKHCGRHNKGKKDDTVELKPLPPPAKTRQKKGRRQSGMRAASATSKELLK